MLTASLLRPETHAPYLQHPVWQRALHRLTAIRPEDPDATIPWEGEKMYVMVQGYTTQPREACRYEAHRRYIDIQLLLAGEEIIEVMSVAGLPPEVPYDGTRDVAFFRTPETRGAQILLRPGDFAIFLPDDAHMPKIQALAPAPLRKAVVKIDLSLFS